MEQEEALNRIRPLLETEVPLLWLGKRGIDEQTTLVGDILTEKTIEEIKSNHHGTLLYQRLPSQTLTGFARGGTTNVIASLLIRGSEQAGKRAASGLPDPGDQQERQEALIQNLALQRIRWYPDADEFLSKNGYALIGEGGEARVYMPDDMPSKDVIKVISTRYFELPELMLDRIALHNYLFPETAMTLFAFGRNSEGDLSFLVKQPFIKGTHLSREQIRRHIEKIGFGPNPFLRFSGEDYLTPLIALGDMHDENLLRTPQGHIAVIDSDVRLNTPELGYKGEWTVPDIAATPDQVKEFDSLINAVLSSRKSINLLVKDTLKNPSEKLLRTVKRISHGM